MLNGLSYTIVAVYGLVTLYRGNLSQLLTMLSKEGRFLELVIAYALLEAIASNPRVGNVGRAFMSMAVFALLLKIVMNPNIKAALTALGNGASITEAFTSATSKP